MTGAVLSMLAISNVVVAVFPRASLTLILTKPFEVKVMLSAACQVVPPSKLYASVARPTPASIAVTVSFTEPFVNTD